MLHDECLRCHKALTDPESRARGYGEDCWSMMGGHVQMIMELEAVDVAPTISDGYAGRRGAYGGVKVVRVAAGVQSELVNAAPDKSESFEWGYEGSGPAALAKSILVDCIGKKGHAAVLYQAFKCAYVAKFAETWELTGDEIRQWVQQQTTATGNDSIRQ